MDTSQIGEPYLHAHARIDGLVRHLPEADLALPVAACPGWTVADVVGHCTGIVEDALAGRLSGPPNDEQTAVQVERYRGRPIGDVLDLWADGADQFAELVTAAGVAPALIDVLSHEQDIRTALNKPGHRDELGVLQAAHLVIAGLDLRPDVIEVVFPDGSSVHSMNDSEEPQAVAAQLRATPFEVLRFRLGRRSPAEVASLDWSSDPSGFMDRLFVFGTREESLGEQTS